MISIFNTTPTEEGEEKTPIFTLDGENVTVLSKSESNSETPNTTTTTSKLNMSKINCMAVFEDLIIYGDSGYNIKILDYQKGNLKGLFIVERKVLGDCSAETVIIIVTLSVDRCFDLKFFCFTPKF